MSISLALRSSSLSVRSGPDCLIFSPFVFPFPISLPLSLFRFLFQLAHPPVSGTYPRSLPFSFSSSPTVLPHIRVNSPGPFPPFLSPSLSPCSYHHFVHPLLSSSPSPTVPSAPSPPPTLQFHSFSLSLSLPTIFPPLSFRPDNKDHLVIVIRNPPSVIPSKTIDAQIQKANGPVFLPHPRCLISNKKRGKSISSA